MDFSIGITVVAYFGGAICTIARIPPVSSNDQRISVSWARIGIFRQPIRPSVCLDRFFGSFSQGPAGACRRSRASSSRR